MKEHGMQAQYSRHARESGHPVCRTAVVNHQRFGILDHPLSRMMTAELENPDVTAKGNI
jgi:hypothetical protein